MSSNISTFVGREIFSMKWAYIYRLIPGPILKKIS
jgi:hypothetical protein